MSAFGINKGALFCAAALGGLTFASASQAQSTPAPSDAAAPPPAGTSQEAAQPPPPSAAQTNGDRSTGLEEVVVTARKRTERLQDVPVTVTAFTAATVERLQTKNVFDLAQQTPGLYYGTSGGRNGGNKLQIRNFSTGTAGPSKASVFIDGQYIVGDYSSTPLANLERIEVLKGPQSAYFGRATFVGAVNFITRDPTNVISGTVDLVAATAGEHDLTGYVSAPIVKDRIWEQVTFREYSFDGPDKWHTTDGLHLGGQGTRSFSSKTVVKPLDNLTLKFNYTYVEDNDEIPPTLYAPLTSRVAIARPGGTFGYYFNGPTSYNFSAPSWGLPTTALTDPGIRHYQNRFSMSYDWKIFDQTVSGYVSHSNEHYKEQLDGNLYLSGTSPTVIPNAVGTPTTATFASSFFNYSLEDSDTQFEIRVSSPETWRLRYTLGYDYVDISGHNQLFLLSGVPIYNQNTYGGSFLNPATDNSVFGGLYLDITKQLTLSFEARYQNEQIEAKTYSTALATYGTQLTDYTARFKAFLPRVNLQYKVNPNLQFYALYSEGNNPGGFQPITPAQAASANVPYAYAEESIQNYEGGVKSRWLDGRLVVDAAVYHMDFSNEQLSQTTPVPGTPTGFASIYLPGVKSKVTGFEAEADAAITRSFQIRATVGYGKAEYVNFCSTPYAALTGIQTGLNCRSVNGKQQEGTPALQTSLSGDYTHRITNDILGYVRGDWEYQSKVYNEEWDQSWIPDFSTINIRGGLEYKNYTLELFIRNLTDNDDSTRSTRVTDGRAAAIASSYPTLGGFSQAIAGEQNIAGTAKKPRQFGVRLNLKF